MQGFSKSDVKNVYLASKDPEVRTYTDVETLNSVYKVLETSIELMIETNSNGGVMTNGSAAGFIAKKTLAIGSLASNNSNVKGVREATFVGGVVLSSVEMGKALTMTPGKGAALILLKTSEKIVAAAGMGNVDKCRMAVAALVVNIGAGGLACAGSVGALCILSAASFALEGFNTYAQCTSSSKVAVKIPP
jgi:hypothetical protein